MPRQKIDFGEIERAILYLLYQIFTDNAPPAISAAQIRDQLRLYPGNVVANCIEALAASGFIKQSGIVRYRDNLADAYMITRTGANVVMGWDDDLALSIERILENWSAVATNAGAAREPTDQIVEQEAGTETTVAVPASDREVPLNHNSKEYREAVDAVDEVIAQVSGDNEYGDKFPEEKAALVSALKAGRSLLDGAKVRVAAIYSTLLPALKFVAEHWLKATIATLAAAAIAKLMSLF